MSDELGEKVARAVALADAKDGCSETLLRSESYMAACRNIADAAIALIWNEAMEEAAKVARSISPDMPDKSYEMKDWQHYEILKASHETTVDIETAIRSLMSKP